MSEHAPKLPAAVQDFARFALHEGFEVQREIYDGSFNSYFRLARESVTVTIIQDRGQWHIDIGRNGMGVRCTEWRRRLGDIFVNGETRVEDEAEFYRRHWDAIVSIASDGSAFAMLPSQSSELSQERLESIIEDVERRRIGHQGHGSERAQIAVTAGS